MKEDRGELLYIHRDRKDILIVLFFLIFLPGILMLFVSMTFLYFESHVHLTLNSIVIYLFLILSVIVLYFLISIINTINFNTIFIYEKGIGSIKFHYNKSKKSKTKKVKFINHRLIKEVAIKRIGKTLEIKILANNGNEYTSLTSGNDKILNILKNNLNDKLLIK
jgi:hypothetical protein